MSRRHRKHHDDHEEHPSEAWLIALADMMTLLMVTFLMMFAISSVDLQKFKTFKEAFAAGTGSSLPGLPGEGVPTEGEPVEEPLAPQVSSAPSSGSAGAGGKVLDPAALQALQKQITAKLHQAKLQDRVEAKIDNRGLVLYVTSGMLFASGQAEVTSQGRALLDGLGPVLRGVGNQLVVEGHTDSRPISSKQFASNWELSAMRATAVARQLMDEADISRKRVSIAGYADTRPRRDAPNEQAYAVNRRVEIVVEAPKAPRAAPARADQGSAASAASGPAPAPEKAKPSGH